MANTPSPSPAIPLFEKSKVSPQSTKPAPWSDRTRTFDPFRPKETSPQLKMMVIEEDKMKKELDDEELVALCTGQVGSCSHPASKYAVTEI